MFHLSDLFAAAGPAPWTPPTADPRTALAARYRLRLLSTRPDDAPRLKLPDAKGFGLLTAAAQQDEYDDATAAAALGACIEAPVLTYVSAPSQDGSRCWWRMCLLTDLGIAGLLRVRGVPGRKSTQIADVALTIRDLDDADEVRSLVEEVFLSGDRPEREVKDRGRTTAPYAVWLGWPEGQPIGDFERALGAVGATSGYRVRVIPRAAAQARTAMQQAAEVQPELVLVWQPYSPPGDFVARLRGFLPYATVEPIEASGRSGALEDARIWFTLSPVLARSAPVQVGPSTLHEAAKIARSDLSNLEVTQQAVDRSASSPYESPSDVYRALEILDELAGAYEHGELDGTTFQSVCDQRGLLYSPKVSEKALNKHGARYEVVVAGEVRVMRPHLRFGGSYDPRYCARVYWWVDRARRKFVIGHIGQHLPGGND